MMKAKELRIGNWVMGNRPYQINLSRLITLAESERQCQQYAEPIPLTEEWLFKFGFELQPGFGYSKYPFLLEGHEMWDLRMNDNYINTIEFVHQLQNLYFALTGKELNE